MRSGLVRGARAALAASLVAGSLGVAASASHAESSGSPAPPETAAPLLSRAESFARAFAGRSGASVRHAHTATGSLAVGDPAGDTSDPRADITSVSATITKTNVRLGVTTRVGSDPTRDPAWTVDGSGVAWGVDTTGDGVVDDVAILIATSDGRLGGLVTDAAGSNVHCYAAGGWDRARTYSVTFPTSCIHASSAIRFGAFTAYGTTSTAQDDAPDSVLAGPVTATATATGVAGGLVLDGWGGLHFTGVGGARTSPGITGAPYWKGWDIARGVATFPGGGQGLVVDGFGGLHGFGIGQNAIPVSPRTTAYWKGRDIARGVAVLADGTGGFVLDGFGGLHWFSLGDGQHAPALSGAPYWPGLDIARGVALLPNGTGGYVVDAFGGLHWFSIGARRGAPAVSGAPSWPNWSIARGVTVMPDGSGGFVIDAWGGLHWFSIGARTTAPVLHGAPYWHGWEVARGVATIAAAPGLPAPASPTPTTTTTTTVPSTTTTTTTTPPSPNGNVVSVSGALQNVVIDAAGHDAYVTNSSANVVDVVDLPTHTLAAAIPVGSAPMGLDLTPDGTKLYVANSGGNNISVVDVASRTELRRITVPSDFANDRPYSIAILDNGKALFTTTFGGSGFGGRMMQLDLATDGLSQRSDTWPNGQTTERSIVVRSGDRSKALLLVGDDSGGPTMLYDATKDSFGPVKMLSTFVSDAALNGDGTEGIVDGRFVLDGNLSLAGTITGGGPAALNAAGTISYRAPAGSALQVLDPVHFLAGSSLALPDTITSAGSAAGRGHLALTPDGSAVAVITDHGLSVRSTS